ncbi:hypothetical protein WJX81_005558 [Elliptochloris bilobata]|uniref:Uncharacterized protein n=1 Tax=Elliptochloris bilobata TaxID=381761 RepID=A0AAW1RQC1_9CHLO
MLGAQHPDACLHHCCKEGCTLFEYTPRKNWSAHTSDKFLLCGGDRFDIILQAGGSLQLQPKQVIYWSGMEVGIQQLFAKPAFGEARLRFFLDPDSNPGFYKSLEWRSQNAKLGGLYDNPMNSHWEFGADGVQPMDRSTHTTDVLLMRCGTLPLAERCKDEFVIMLGLVAGKKQRLALL